MVPTTTCGNAYFDMGQYQRAIEDYDEAIQLQPDVDAFYNNRGHAYLKLGQYAKAKVAADKVCSLNSKRC